jgi:hypothetical protein
MSRYAGLLSSASDRLRNVLLGNEASGCVRMVVNLEIIPGFSGSPLPLAVTWPYSRLSVEVEEAVPVTPS